MFSVLSSPVYELLLEVQDKWMPTKVVGAHQSPLEQAAPMAFLTLTSKGGSYQYVQDSPVCSLFYPLMSTVALWPPTRQRPPAHCISRCHSPPAY